MHMARILRNIISAYNEHGQQTFVDEQATLSSLCQAYDTVWDGSCRRPRQAHDRTKMAIATYFAWFDSGSWLRRPQYLFVGLPASSICTYLRFRLGTHNLQVELGRWHDHRPRCQRVCDRCDMHAVDDEWHLVFECPAFEHLRSARQHLFVGFDVPNMTAFMRQCDQMGVTCHILACIQKIKALADVDRSFDVDLSLYEEPDSYDSDDD